MADEKTVWIDLDEVDAAAKKIMGLLDELNGPANKLEAAVKQVQESVYGTDLLGKALLGGSSSVGGLAQHQEQVLAGIRTLMQNATAVGENLQSMVARHRANDDEQATAIGRITDTGAMPTDPQLPGALSSTVGTTPVGTVPASLPDAPRLPLLEPDGVQAVPASLPDAPLRPLLEPDGVQHPTPPPPPAPITPIGDTNPGVGYHDPDAPELDYNHPNPLMRPGYAGGAGPRVI
ncbi:hypothetical protein K353_02956 [Kitasatospora sp. SolWspMP-SS2h]|uniref:hypothetical protein n=1 Tax=Kitasatospora sp. SolWspMP-SS2h TaxID=1305729 RepID=UPI000DBFDE28|nr:hypothetical protein [Kitasatospora sp. SolWspMP-SS2h]RAJ41845.1 hypothetical protein K353_02956 [Kitasatospora sp. SolWspMP-SS2h]